jgi:SAM-dependent methyltransferase
VSGAGDGEEARERWDRRYAESGDSAPARAPSEWLAENEDLLRAHAGPGRRALDVAAGSGRNALYLAELGFEVEAVDISEVGLARLRAAADERGLPVHTRVADLESDGLGPGAYELVVNLNYLQRDLFDPLRAALAPGGLLLFETFGPAHLAELGKRVSPEFVLGPGELRDAFAALRIVRYAEGVAERSGRPRGVASLAAERAA